MVVISRCIEFDPVRYNGDMISSDHVAMMKPFVRFIPVCPEVEIGLGIPRSAIRIVRTGDGDRLIQPSTGDDITDPMNRFCSSFLEKLPLVDGFILKNKSPTSGISNVNIYPSAEKSAPIEKGPGFFGGMILERYPFYPVEDEGRIRNQRIRDHFLTRIFLLADFRRVKEKGTLSALSRFHGENKLLLMAYNQSGLQELGKIVANSKKEASSDCIDQYLSLLLQSTRFPVRYTSQINVLLHSIGYLSERLSSEEKAFFLSQVEGYRRGHLALSSLRIILQAWLLRDGHDALRDQTWFAPYPDDMMILAPEETERGREMY